MFLPTSAVVMTSVTVRGLVFVLASAYWMLSGTDLLPSGVQSMLYQAHRVAGLYLVSSGVVGKLSRRLKPVSLAFSIHSGLELISIIIVTKLVAHLVLILVNTNIFVLFKATTFTASLAWTVASLTPLLLLALAPVIQRAAWYYVIAYCALCGGSVFASVVGLSVGLGLVWRHTVVHPIVSFFII